MNFASFTEIDSKWNIGLKVKCETIKLLVNNLDENLGNVGFGDEFLDATPKAKSMKEKSDK